MNIDQPKQEKLLPKSPGEISYVVGLHGNELLPAKALIDEGIPHHAGNPNAIEKDVRFTQQDLNASFGRPKKGFGFFRPYEEKRAEQLLDEIPEENFIVDFHTTTATTEPFTILVDEKMLDFAATTGIEKVVIMDSTLKGGHALINHRHGISMEMGHHDDREASYDLVKEVVRNIEKGEPHPIKIYEVYGPITEPGEYENFKMHPDGFIPILAGEKSYELRKPPIYGLKAREQSTSSY